MSPLTAITGLYGQGLLYGGPAVLIWGWVLTGCFTMLVGLAMGELSSKFPVSGGLYFWSFMLAGQYGPCASWLVGWVNMLGQIAFVSSNTYTFVQFFAAGLFLYSGSPAVIGYYPSNGMQLYVYGGLLIVYASINGFPLKTVTKLARIGTWWLVAGSFIIVLTLLMVTKKHQKWSWVLADFESNAGAGITNNIYIFVLGLLTACWSFTGYDASAHLIEETMAADATAGWPILYAIGASFVIGLVYLLSLTVCIQDLTDLTNPTISLSGSYVAQIMWDVFESRYGYGLPSLLLMLVPLGAICFCGILSITSASRMLYGFSRDGAVPFSETWMQVDKATGVPLHAVWAVTSASFIMGLPLLQGPAAFLATTSIATVGLALCYGLPIGLHVLASNRFEAGAFTLGRWSVPVGYVSFTWLMFCVVIFMLPTAYPITGVTFNFAPAVLGGILLLAGVVWCLTARFWFAGPRTDVHNSDVVKVQYWISDPPRRCN
ncbi:hypothetical protein WJX77_006203 [Trebouxia sp. C0004]